MPHSLCTKQNDSLVVVVVIIANFAGKPFA
jgi:hypothetical protein